MGDHIRHTQRFIAFSYIAKETRKLFELEKKN